MKGRTPTKENVPQQGPSTGPVSVSSRRQRPGAASRLLRPLATLPGSCAAAAPDRAAVEHPLQALKRRPPTGGDAASPSKQQRKKSKPDRRSRRVSFAPDPELTMVHHFEKVRRRGTRTTRGAGRQRCSLPPAAELRTRAARRGGLGSKSVVPTQGTASLLAG